MSSSNRSPVPCAAALYRGDQPVGPMRLPMDEVASFIDEFNRVYHNVGITIEPVPTTDTQPAQASKPESAGGTP